MNRSIFSDARRLACTAAGAIAVSALCVAGVVAPAYAQPAANAPLTVADWQADVGAQLDARLNVPAGALAGRDHLLATVAVSFDAAGDFARARIARSSGNGAVDARVVGIAGGLRYPPLPAGYRGTARTVLMQAYFAEVAGPSDAWRHARAADALASRAAPRHDALQTAALPTG